MPLPHPIVLLFVRNNDVVVFTATYYLLWKFLGKPLLPPVNSFESRMTWFCWVGWSLISILFQRSWPRCTFFPAVQVKSVCVYVNIRIKRKKMKIIHVMLGFFFPLYLKMFRLFSLSLWAFMLICVASAPSINCSCLYGQFPAIQRQRGYCWRKAWLIYR